MIGPRYTLRDHQVRDFLSRNRVPYVWLDPEQSAEGVDLLLLELGALLGGARHN